MCGICGFLNSSQDWNIEKHENVLRAMLAKIQHRGPDDNGQWSNTKDEIGMGHVRLSIQDLSSNGHQPMISNDKRYVIVYNGEVYNFKEIRKELINEGIGFVSDSDTEVVLASIMFWGLDYALEKFNGMFAFALWDSIDKTLTLVRDRLGIKPLYFSIAGSALVFASELDALMEHPLLQTSMNYDVLGDYLRYAYISEPHTIYKNVKKLRAGSYLKISIKDMQKARIPEEKKYWPPVQMYSIDENKINNNRSIDDFQEELHLLLEDSVRLRMIADVPVGTFLSGGIDSSLITAIAQSVSDNKVNTFSIGFEEKEYDESKFARGVAKHIGTNHDELIIGEKDILEIVTKIPEVFGEPFADSSQFPTLLVSHFARRSVKVVMAGDGGDELFYGYNWYHRIPKSWKGLQKLSPVLRNALGKALSLCPIAVYNMFDGIAGKHIKSDKRSDRIGGKIHKFSDMLRYSSNLSSYARAYNSYFASANDFLLQDCEDNFNSTDWNHHSFTNPADLLAYIDQKTYLPDRILCKTDRTTMSVALEARVPLLDHRIVEFAWKLPVQHKIAGNKGKLILRNILRDYMPSSLFERPKSGFEAPIGKWIVGPLNSLTEDLLQSDMLKRQGIFNCKMIEKAKREHFSSKRDWSRILWNIMVFQMWYNKCQVKN